MAGYRSGRDSGGIRPDRPGPPGASCPGDAFDEAAYRAHSLGRVRFGEREEWRFGRVRGSGRSMPPVRGLDRPREISGGKREDDGAMINSACDLFF